MPELNHLKLCSAMRKGPAETKKELSALEDSAFHPSANCLSDILNTLTVAKEALEILMLLRNSKLFCRVTFETAFQLYYQDIITEYSNAPKTTELQRKLADMLDILSICYELSTPISLRPLKTRALYLDCFQLHQNIPVTHSSMLIDTISEKFIALRHATRNVTAELIETIYSFAEVTKNHTHAHAYLFQQLLEIPFKHHILSSMHINDSLTTQMELSRIYNKYLIN